MPHSASQRSAAQRLSFLAPLACACLAFASHTLPFISRVFHPFGVVLYGDGDAYYHLHRIRSIAASWPRVEDFDPYLSFPEGAYSIWPPGFDYVPATLARLGLPLETVAVYWPALLSALACLPFYAYCRRRFGHLAAVSGSISLALVPETVLIGALGRIDHHIAELLFQLLIYAQLQRCSDAYDAGSEVTRRDWIWLGFTMGGALLTWFASLLFLAVPAALGVILHILAPGPSAQRMSRLLVRAFILAALIALPYGALNWLRGRDPFSPHLPSLLQSIACLLMAVCIQAASQLRRSQRNYFQLGLTAAALLALLCTPGVARSLAKGLAFLSRDDQAAWLTTVSEVQPLLSSAEVFAQGTRAVGYTLWLIPIAVLWQAARCLRERHWSSSGLLLLGWSSHVFALSLLQVRFLQYAVPIIALLPWWLYELSRQSLQRLAAPIALLAVLLLWPTTEFYAPLWRGGLLSYPQYRADLYSLLHELPQQTPAKPATCVFAEWDVGHVTVEVAQRPVVANNFGTHLGGTSYAESIEFFEHAMQEDAALAPIDRRGCRYVLTPARRPRAAGSAQASFARRVHDADASDSAAGSGSGRLRLLLETLGPPVSGQPAYKLFELVKGARLIVGSSSNDLTVETHIKGPRRDFWYRRKLTRQSPQARLEARLAYPGAYRLLQGQQPVFSLNIPDEAVTLGKSITVSEH